MYLRLGIGLDQGVLMGYCGTEIGGILMAFGIGTNSSNTFPGPVRGKQKQIAYEC